MTLGPRSLGLPRRHLRVVSSTNDVAIACAQAGATHGTLVTAATQTAGRGRQGRSWIAAPGRALLASLLVREYDALIPLRAGLAVADLAGPDALVKWPNDVLVGGGKLAGVLVEARPQSDWAVVGVGINVAVDRQLPPAAATLGRSPAAIEPTLSELLAALELRLAEPAAQTLAALRARDALRDRPVRWAQGTGVGAGIDSTGALLVRTTAGIVALNAGEVHLLPGDDAR